MLKIRNEQINVFQQAAVRDFEDQLVKYVGEHFPKHYGNLGETGVRKVVRYGLNRAESHRLIDKRSISLYVSFMFMLGSHFDTDPQLPWALEILKDEITPDEKLRIDRLYDKVMEYFDHVAGDNEYIDKALRRIRKEQIESLSSSGSGGLLDDMTLFLNKIFPQKCEYIGEDLIRSMILHGIKAAKRYNITDERGLIIYISLMFILGSSFDTDPQFPWVMAILNDETTTDETEKILRLYTEAATRLDKWLA